MSNAPIGCYDGTLEIPYLIANRRIPQTRRATDVECALNGALPLAITHRRVSDDWRTSNRRIRQSDLLAVGCASRRISILTYIYLTLSRSEWRYSRQRIALRKETRFIRRYPSDEEQCRTRWWMNGNYRRRQSLINNWRKVIAIDSEIRDAVALRPSLSHLGLSEKYCRGAPCRGHILSALSFSLFMSTYRPTTYVCTD